MDKELEKKQPRKLEDIFIDIEGCVDRNISVSWKDVIAEIKSLFKKKAKDKEIKGLVHGGFNGECNNRNPWYIIPKPNSDGIFICSLLQKYAGKKVKITIEPIDQKFK